MYRLPNRKGTEDVTEFEAAWQAIIGPLEKHYGLIVTAFDPDIQARPADANEWGVVTIPLWLARKMIEKVADVSST